MVSIRSAVPPSKLCTEEQRRQDKLLHAFLKIYMCSTSETCWDSNKINIKYSHIMGILYIIAKVLPLTIQFLLPWRHWETMKRRCCTHQSYMCRCMLDVCGRHRQTWRTGSSFPCPSTHKIAVCQSDLRTFQWFLYSNFRLSLRHSLLVLEDLCCGHSFRCIRALWRCYTRSSSRRFLS